MSRGKYKINIKDNTEILNVEGNKINYIELNVGDRVAITWFGMIEQLDPGYIPNVIKIQSL